MAALQVAPATIQPLMPAQLAAGELARIETRGGGASACVLARRGGTLDESTAPARAAPAEIDHFGGFASRAGGDPATDTRVVGRRVAGVVAHDCGASAHAPALGRALAARAARREKISALGLLRA